MCMESQHEKHEWMFCSGGKDIIVNMIIVGQYGWKEENKVFINFWLLKQGCFFIDFQDMKLSFNFFKVKKTPKTYWSNNISWEITI